MAIVDPTGLQQTERKTSSALSVTCLMLACLHAVKTSLLLDMHRQKPPTTHRQLQV